MNELHEKIIRPAQSVTYEILGKKQYHLDVCYATNVARVEIYQAHEKLCVVQCLKMYQFLQ
jgi:hypothetical protein